MPAGREGASGDSPEPRPQLVAHPADAVAFLDAPGVAPADLTAAMTRAVAELPRGSVLAVYSDHDAAGDAVTDLCAGTGAELVATIQHDGQGATFAIRL